MSLRSASTACSRRGRASTSALLSEFVRARRRIRLASVASRTTARTHRTNGRSSRSGRSRRCSRRPCWRTWRRRGSSRSTIPSKTPTRRRRHPRPGRPITLADLASHTSGLPRLPKGFLLPAMLRERRNPYASFTVDELHAAIPATRPRRAPGRRSATPTTASGSSGTHSRCARAPATASSSPSASRGRSDGRHGNRGAGDEASTLCRGT